MNQAVATRPPFTLGLPYITAAMAFGVYLTTMATHLAPIDAGELIGVQLTAGVPHATGYPLFVMLGWLWQQLPIGSDPIVKSSLLSAILTASAIGVVTQTGLWLLTQFQNLDSLLSKVPNWVAPVLVAVASLLFGLNYVVISQGSSVEVYSLHLLLFSLCAYRILLAYVSKSELDWIIVGLVLALCFSNHMSSILLIPGLAYLYFKQRGFQKEAIILGVKMVASFAIIVGAMYGFLVWRASTNPLFNWGNITNWPAFTYHVTGRQFSNFFFAGKAVFYKQAAHFAKTVFPYTGYIGLVLAFLGMLLPIQFNGKGGLSLKLYLAITIITCLGFGFNYDIVDIDNYFLAAYWGIAIFSVLGLLYIANKLGMVSVGIAAAAIGLTGFVTIPKADQSDMLAYEDFYQQSMAPLEPNAVIFAYTWDYFIAPYYYFHYTQKAYPNTILVDKELLRRSWYYPQLERFHPGTLKVLDNLIQPFQVALIPFEAGKKDFNAEALEKYYSEIQKRLVQHYVASGRPVYFQPAGVTPNVVIKDFGLPDSLTLVPMGFMNKLVSSKTAYVPYELPTQPIRFRSAADHYETNLAEICYYSLYYRSQYEAMWNQPEKANAAYQAAMQYYAISQRGKEKKKR